MEDFPSAPAPEARSNNRPEKKNKRRNKRPKLAIPQLASVDDKPKDKAPKQENSRLDDALASLLIERQGESEKPSAAKEKPEKQAEEPKAEVSDETVAETDAAAEGAESADQPMEVKETGEKAEEDAEKDDDEDDGKEYEPLAAYEPEPTEFSGGEVIIHLQGDTPVAERVVPLETDGETAAPEPEELPVPAFSTVPEQQHQERDATVARESSPVARPEAGEPVAPTAGGELPPVPPSETSGATFAEPPERRQPLPAEIHYGQTDPNRVTALSMVPAEQLVTKRQLEDELYYAQKSGLQQGLIAGAVAGGAYEHFKHKRREKKQAKRFDAQAKQLENTTKEYGFAVQEQTRQNAEHGRQIAGLKSELAQRPSPEKLMPQRVPEQIPSDLPEQLAAPDGHRFETSAWHTIEVDAKTGRPVENPTFRYGHEYYRERAPESGPPSQRHAAAGEVALVAAAGAGGGAGASNLAPGSSNVSLPQVQIPDASTQGAPPASQALRDIPAVAPKPSNNAPLWPWITALVVIVVALIALLH
ncbi:MAG: hypothetical protein WDN27_02285 [Candidatus Saccharibacteria bacterium]